MTREFVKRLDNAPPQYFEAEADGLARLAAAGARVPTVRAVSPTRLVLDFIEPGPPRWEDAGRMLATIHAATAPCFGLERQNFMGRVPQDNRPASDPTFATFFRERRLDPLAGLLPPALRARLDRLRIDRILTEPDRPRLVHGDLWSGNLVHAAAGPTYIDPAVYYGHPEVDLAMARLFGGFAPAFEAAYREAMGQRRHPDDDFARRVTCLQLYPLLIHLHMFGGGYLSDIEAALDALE